MAQKVLKVGSSLAVTIPKQLAEKLKWKPGDRVEVRADPSHQRVTYYSQQEPLSSKEMKIAEIAYRFIQRYRKDLEALAQK